MEGVDIPGGLCGVAFAHQSGDLFPFWARWSGELNDCEEELLVCRVGPASFRHGCVIKFGWFVVDDVQVLEFGRVLVMSESSW